MTDTGPTPADEVKLKEDVKKFGFTLSFSGWNDSLNLKKNGVDLVNGDFGKVRDWMDGFMEGKKK